MRDKKGFRYRVKHTLYVVFLTIVSITSIIGTLGVYNFLVVGVYGNYNLIFTLGGWYSSLVGIQNTMISDENMTKLEIISNQLTDGCLSDKCKAFKIYSHLKTFKYELGVEVDPIYTWEQKSGDCDEISNLLINLLDAQDIKSHLVCETTHCWVIAELDGMKTHIDTVNGIYRELRQ